MLLSSISSRGTSEYWQGSEHNHEYTVKYERGFEWNAKNAACKGPHRVKTRGMLRKGGSNSHGCVHTEWIFHHGRVCYNYSKWSSQRQQLF